MKQCGLLLLTRFFSQNQTYFYDKLYLEEVPSLLQTEDFPHKPVPEQIQICRD